MKDNTPEYHQRKDLEFKQKVIVSLVCVNLVIITAAIRLDHTYASGITLIVIVCSIALIFRTVTAKPR